jgi:hypothetical protein
MRPQPRLAMLILFGVAAYAAMLLAFARPLVDEVRALVLRRNPPATAQAL